VRIHKTLGILFFSVFMAGTANAQPRAGVFVGGDLLSNELELGNSYHDDQVPGSGFLFGARFGYGILPRISPDSALNPGLFAELEAKLLLSSTAGDDAEMRASSSSPVLGWRLNAVLDMMQHKRVVPFALVGVGGETVFGNDNYINSPDTDSAFFVGGGARFAVNQQVHLRADLRLGLTAGRFDPISALGEFQVGAAYLFGSAEEEEQPLVVDKPEPEPEPKLADTDGDGIPDIEDVCPKMAEIVNQIDDKDGCPEVDSDGDGLLGSLDKCPAAAEDKDGYDDDDGCPDDDNDSDGVADAMDKCPIKPETVNGFEDEDGCPDELPEPIKQYTGTIEGIKFRSGSARILRKSEKTLRGALKVMQDYPAIRIEISGHTDNRGSDALNRQLARKRADYVKWWLVDKGIEASRIETAGHGPDKPVADNDTREGRQKNRRIEFRLLSNKPVPPTPSEVPAAEEKPEAAKP
jgi:OOP family OmpA-OmpF porin